MNMESFDSFHSNEYVKDMESQILWAFGKTPNKKICFKPNFKNVLKFFQVPKKFDFRYLSLIFSPLELTLLNSLSI